MLGKDSMFKASDEVTRKRWAILKTLNERVPLENILAMYDDAIKTKPSY